MSNLLRPNPPPAQSMNGAEAQLIWHDPYDPARRREVIKILLLWAVAIAAYVPALSGEFLWRDDQVITANESIRSLPTLAHVWRHPRSVLLWRPVADTILWPQHIVWRNWNASGYHLISLAFHLVNTLLIWRLMRRLNLCGALAGAGLFALHPIAVHAAGWLAQQPVLVATMFSLAAVLVWLRWSEIDPPLPEVDGAWNLSHRKWLLAAVTMLLLLAALLADAPTACFVPLAMYIIAWWKFADARTITPLAILALGVTAFVEWEHHSQFIDPTAPATTAMVVVVSRGAWFHLLKLIVPYPLLLAYPRWTVAAAWAWIFPAALLVAIALITWKRDRIGRGVVAGALAFLALLIPPLALYDPQGGGFTSDAQQYLARAALLIVAAAVIAPLVPEPDEEGRHRATRPLVAVALVLLLVGLTWSAGDQCRNNRAAWEHVLAHDPNSRIARAELGSLYLAAGNANDAAAEFHKLVTADPSDADAQMRLGEALLQGKHSDDAAAHFEKAAALLPRDPEPLRLLGAADERRGDLPAAVAHYEHALAINPRDDRSRNNLATLYARRGDNTAALAEFERALADNPHSTKTHLNIANLLMSMGRLDDAAAHLREAVKIDPGNAEVYITSGGILLKFEDFQNAARMFRAAVRINHNSPEAFNLLGVALAAQGEYGEAIYNFGRALDLRPDYAAAKQNLEAAQRQRDVAKGAAPATTRTGR